MNVLAKLLPALRPGRHASREVCYEYRRAVARARARALVASIAADPERVQRHPAAEAGPAV